MQKTTMLIPTHMVGAVKKLLRDDATKRNPKPIKRKLRISKNDFKRGGWVVKEHVALGRLRDRYLDKLGNEYERLEDLLSSPRTKADAKWLEAQLDRLERAIDYVEND